MSPGSEPGIGMSIAREAVNSFRGATLSLREELTQAPATDAGSNLLEAA